MAEDKRLCVVRIEKDLHESLGREAGAFGRVGIPRYIATLLEGMTEEQRANAYLRTTRRRARVAAAGAEVK